MRSIFARWIASEGRRAAEAPFFADFSFAMPTVLKLSGQKRSWHGCGENWDQDRAVAIRRGDRCRRRRAVVLNYRGKCRFSPADLEASAQGPGPCNVVTSAPIGNRGSTDPRGKPTARGVAARPAGRRQLPGPARNPVRRVMLSCCLTLYLGQIGVSSEPQRPRERCLPRFSQTVRARGRASRSAVNLAAAGADRIRRAHAKKAAGARLFFR